MLFNREMSDSEAESLPFETEEAAANLVSSLFPDKSKTKYEKFYKRLTDWCASKKINHEAREKVLLAFFEELLKSYQCSNLWAVCEGYIDTSIKNKKKTASNILGGDPGARTSTASSYNRDSSIVRREILNTGAVTNILSTKPKHYGQRYKSINFI
ncbi:hypothetical protein Zmor_013776 [Zophobas morio]|uniref:Uncharacterized protein n=1 Tax=Zophobas morio TaxID=2755281 RepID=A0AA38IE73_9CUCU|nr:hypothetical protein Zmor_025848 [Zophobas morio]KAJ3654600.1 hypothetical protein Zmor_013776 [Zophobas morio]